jgi:hypothetical protein
MRSLKLTFLLLITILVSCKDNANTITELENIHATIKKEFAPDKRVELFDVRFKNANNTIVLTGETTTKKALNLLLDSLKNKNVNFKNNVRVLPDSAVGKKTFALGNNSVINIRSKPKHSAELGTQGLLGMELKVLDKKGSWYRVQTPDKYISWVDAGGIERMNKDDFDKWNFRKKVIFTKNFGYVYADKSKNSKIVSDITIGGVLKFISMNSDFFEVEYPDKRKGFLKREEALMYESWLHKLNPSQEKIETIAKSMDGFPYLWGGTSSKGIDCSGFTKMVYLMNGFVIPRDASQQIHAGKIVDENLKFDGLKKGDLMFFGTPAKGSKKQRVTHVGIWLGNEKGEFIHSASNVHLSSINENEKHYDGFNKNRYLGSRRYLGVEDDKIIDLKKYLIVKP